MAMSGRLYTVSFQNVAVTAVQDAISVIAGANKVLGIHAFELGQITKTAVEILRVRLRLYPATVTNGSIGTAPTPRPISASDTAATFTARANDTTQMTSSGTAVDLWADQWNLVNGLLWVPPISGRPFIVGVSQAAALVIDTAPSVSITVNGSMMVEELA